LVAVPSVGQASAVGRANEKDPKQIVYVCYYPKRRFAVMIILYVILSNAMNINANYEYDQL
jgi:hypothetical protein